MSRALRIISIGHADSPQFAERTRELVRLGHEVYELTGCLQSVGGGKIVDLRGAPLGKFWRLTALSRMFMFWFITRRINADVVLVHYAKGLWAWLAPLAGCPLVVSVMGGDILFDEQGVSTPLDRAATKGLLQAASLCICKTPYLAERVHEFSGASQVSTCSFGVNQEIFHPGAGLGTKNRLGLAEGELLVFSPRVMQELYNIKTVVRAFALFAAKRAAKLVLATYRADPDYLESVRSLCNELGIEDRIIFLPPQNATGMAAHFAAADFCISIPSSDGMPQSYFESAACGTPMLMTDLPHYHERIVHGQSGWLVAAKEPELAKAMTKLGDDLALRKGLAAGACRVLERLSLEEGYQCLEDLLHNASNAPGPGVTSRMSQAWRAVRMLFGNTPIVARTGQPVHGSLWAYLRALLGSSGRNSR